MTRERTKMLEPVLKAWAEEGQIQRRIKGLVAWDVETDPSPDFSDERYEWRVAPALRKVWISEYPYDSFGVPRVSRQEADSYAGCTRIACHEVELPPLEQ